MSAHDHDVWVLLDKLQMDLRQVSARFTELRAHVAALELTPPSEAKCPECDLRLRGRLKLAEHLYHAHDGPEPPHWLVAEAIAAPDEEPALEETTP